MADSFTSNLNLNKVEVGASRDTWGGKINDNMDKIDAGVGLIQRQIAAAGANSGGPAPQGRLTFQTGTPVMYGDVNSSVTCYYTPYQGNSLPVYDTVNKAFVAAQFAEMAQDLTDTKFSPAATIAGAVYDLFVWRDKITAAEVTAAAAVGVSLNAGDPILRFGRGYPWNSTTTRGTGQGTTELTRSGPYLVNRYSFPNGPAAGAGTYLGSVYVSPSNRLDWSLGGGAVGGAPVKLHCYNYYNRIVTIGKCSDTTGSHASTSTIRAYNGSQNNSASVLVGMQEDGMEIMVKAAASNGGAQSSHVTNVCIGINQYTTADYKTRGNDSSYHYNVAFELVLPMPAILGRNVFYCLEDSESTSMTWADNARDQWITAKLIM